MVNELKDHAEQRNATKGKVALARKANREETMLWWEKSRQLRILRRVYSVTITNVVRTSLKWV